MTDATQSTIDQSILNTLRPSGGKTHICTRVRTPHTHTHTHTHIYTRMYTTQTHTHTH